MATEVNHPESELVLIEREKQKTKRQMMFYILLGVIAITGLFLVFSGKDGKRNVGIDISKGKFEFSVDKPIVEQTEQKTETTVIRGKKIDFTTGSLNKSVLSKLSVNKMAISPSRFTGKNLINKQAGYILTVERPELWNVAYNQDGLTNSMIPVNVISRENAEIRVTMSAYDPSVDFKTQVQQAMQQLQSLGVISTIPDIKYGADGYTAFLTYTNQLTGGISYQKMMVKDGKVYCPTANYNKLLTPQTVVDDLVNMVASFTTIDG